MSPKHWNIQFDIKKDREKIEPLCRDLGISPVTAVLLWNRGCRDAESARAFLTADESTLHDPFLLRDMDSAVARIGSALERGEKIVIYGDYDVDGVTSVTLLYSYLCGLGGDVFYHIPCRSGEGYGISLAAVDDIAASGARLMISVDCGITAADEIEYARTKGVDTVVTDHHECHEKLPDACAVINPRRADCAYPFKELAGVGVAFNLVCALEISRCPGQTRNAVMKRLCAEYCDLTSIGTVADVMPLYDFNRYIVSLGLEALREPVRPGIAALCEVCAGKGAERRRRISSSYIGFVIAPKINAAGRLADASIAVELLLSRDRETADKAAQALCDMNRLRQDEENLIFTKAQEKIRAEHDFEHDPVIVLAEENWHHGVIGIVASRITERYNMPSIMISLSQDGLGKGSGRSIKGLNLVEALSACSDTLVKYGGHELAAGLSIESEKLGEFKRRINEYAREHLTREAMELSLNAECELEGSDITIPTIEEFNRLEPYGVANPVPRFAVSDACVCDITGVGGDRHTRLTVDCGGGRITAMYFNISPASLPYQRGDRADLLFTLEVNEFRGERSPQLTVRDMQPCAAVREAIDSQRELYRSITAGNPVSRELAAIPTYVEFADIYRELVRRSKQNISRFGAVEISRKMHWAGGSSFVKVKLITDILTEMKLLEATPREDAGDDIYIFRIIPPRTKTNLDKSVLYNRIRAQQK